MKNLVLLCCIFTGLKCFAQSPHVYLDGKYYYDTTSVGKELTNTNTKLTLIKMESDKYCSAFLNKQKVFIRTIDIVANDALNPWLIYQEDLLYKKNHKKYSDSLYKATIKKYGLKYGKDIYNGTIRIGQPKRIIIAIMGDPSDINRTVTGNSVFEQWVYNKDDQKTEYYYFTNGILTSWQD